MRTETQKRRWKPAQPSRPGSSTLALLSTSLWVTQATRPSLTRAFPHGQATRTGRENRAGHATHRHMAVTTGTDGGEHEGAWGQQRLGRVDGAAGGRRSGQALVTRDLRRLCAGAGSWLWASVCPGPANASVQRCVGTSWTTRFRTLGAGEWGGPGLSCSSCLRGGAGPSLRPKPAQRLSLGHSPGHGRAWPATHPGRPFLWGPWPASDPSPPHVSPSGL